MVNLIARMVSVEVVWRQCGEWNFSGDFIVNFVWRFPGSSEEENGKSKYLCQLYQFYHKKVSPSMLTPYQLCTVYITPIYYGDKIIFLANEKDQVIKDFKQNILPLKSLYSYRVF